VVRLAPYRREVASRRREVADFSDFVVFFRNRWGIPSDVYPQMAKSFFATVTDENNKRELKFRYLYVCKKKAARRK
jgi:hypothetical protein